MDAIMGHVSYADDHLRTATLIDGAPPADALVGRQVRIERSPWEPQGVGHISKVETDSDCLPFADAGGSGAERFLADLLLMNRRRVHPTAAPAAFSLVRFGTSHRAGSAMPPDPQCT